MNTLTLIDIIKILSNNDKKNDIGKLNIIKQYENNKIIDIIKNEYNLGEDKNKYYVNYENIKKRIFSKLISKKKYILYICYKLNVNIMIINENKKQIKIYHLYNNIDYNKNNIIYFKDNNKISLCDTNDIENYIKNYNIININIINQYNILNKDISMIYINNKNKKIKYIDFCKIYRTSEYLINEINNIINKK
jgi:hypothetical protein